jgi:heme exporter protein B
MSAFTALVLRELRLSAAGGWASLTAVLFYLAVAVLTPFAIGPAPQLLAKIGGGMAWLAALLASLLTLERLFQPDSEDGTLDGLVSAGVALELIAAAKMLAHWLVTALPLLLATPVVAILLQLPETRWPLLLGSLLLGTPLLSALGAIAAALAVGVKRAGLLIALLVLPLSVPALIFGVGTLDPAASATAFKILGAMTLASVGLTPFAVAAALRASFD